LPDPGISSSLDYRSSKTGRRRSWFGFKKHVKSFLGLQMPSYVLRLIVLMVPALRQSGRLPAPSHLKEVAGQVQGTRFVMLGPGRCIVAKELYWGGGRRPRPEDNLAVELFAILARHADVMLDIGAYTGIFTLVGTLVNPGLEAHAFEIVPEVHRALRDNCARNGILDRTTLYNVGVGAPGALMTVPAESRDSALPSFYSSRLHFDSGVQIEFRSLDSMTEVIPIESRVVVKVDVEGTETAVFRCGQRFLAAFQPHILCEVLAGVADAPRLQGLLQPHGYRFYLIRDADLVPADRITPHPRFRDWLFTKLDSEAISALGLSLAGGAEADSIPHSAGTS
jgi:FkbM family methyltransferase